jgi:hypothetical protein
VFLEECSVGLTPTLRCTGKSAEVIDGKGVGSAPLRPKSAELNEKTEVRCQRFEVRVTAAGVHKFAGSGLATKGKDSTDLAIG